MHKTHIGKQKRTQGIPLQFIPSTLPPSRPSFPIISITEKVGEKQIPRSEIFGFVEELYTCRRGVRQIIFQTVSRICFLFVRHGIRTHQTKSLDHDVYASLSPAHETNSSTSDQPDYRIIPSKRAPFMGCICCSRITYVSKTCI